MSKEEYGAKTAQKRGVSPAERTLRNEVPEVALQAPKVNQSSLRRAPRVKRMRVQMKV
jgi:hypothetical protein